MSVSSLPALERVRSESSPTTSGTPQKTPVTPTVSSEAPGLDFGSESVPVEASHEVEAVEVAEEAPKSRPATEEEVSGATALVTAAIAAAKKSKDPKLKNMAKGLQKGKPPWGIDAVVKPGENAATDAGKVVMNPAWVTNAKTDLLQVQAVLAHEVAHTQWSKMLDPNNFRDELRSHIIEYSIKYPMGEVAKGETKAAKQQAWRDELVERVCGQLTKYDPSWVEGDNLDTIKAEVGRFVEDDSRTAGTTDLSWQVAELAGAMRGKQSADAVLQLIRAMSKGGIFQKKWKATARGLMNEDGLQVLEFGNYPMEERAQIWKAIGGSKSSVPQDSVTMGAPDPSADPVGYLDVLASRPSATSAGLTKEAKDLLVGLAGKWAPYKKVQGWCATHLAGVAPTAYDPLAMLQAKPDVPVATTLAFISSKSTRNAFSRKAGRG